MLNVKVIDWDYKTVIQLQHYAFLATAPSGSPMQARDFAKIFRLEL